MANVADNFSDHASNKELLERAKNEFNREKRLIIKNLPSNTTEKDIRAFMGFNGEFPVESVHMVKNLNQAIVTLKDPSLVDDAISKLDSTKLDTLTVSVSVYRSEKVLCIAQLPLSMTEYKFRELVLDYGNIDMCFLMRSEDTGESKGYGFVEYNEPIEKVGQIKCALDWSEVDGHTVHCDAIVDSSQSGITFQDLHSKCLIIDNLPKDYSDSFVLRQLFSELVKPVYCQIVTKEGESLGFGILEYDSAEDAEKAFNEFNQHEVNGVPMNISYCIPGKSAIHMFNRIMYKYGDKVQVNRASLLPDPVYPNPAFLKHVFFKTHVAKHPRLLVQFTDNLLHLQEGYVKQLEDRTNAKPGILGPPPTIPMSPLMDINLQLGLLSVIVLDMREKGTYNGEVPEPLGKVKIPKDDEFQEKPQPVSLLGDPMTAQANIILKNLLMPPEKPEFLKSSSDESSPKLLGKPVHELNMVYLCSFGRLMAMLSEKNQSMGILGSAPSGPPKPLMEGLMQAGKVAQTLLNNMGIGQQNQQNQPARNQAQQRDGNQQSLLGNPPNILGNQPNMNTAKAASNFMNTIQQLAMQKMSQVGSKQNMNSLFGGNSAGNMNNNSSNTGDGLLGSYQGQGRLPSLVQNQMAPRAQQGKQPQSLLSLNFNNKGDGLMPTPSMEEDSMAGLFGNQGGSYDDSGYQGGSDDTDYTEAYGDNYGNTDNRNNSSFGNMMGQKLTARKLTDQDQDIGSNSSRFDGAYFSGINARQKTGVGPGMNRMNFQPDKREGHYSDIAQQAAFYAAGAAAAYKQQYEDWVQSGYGGGYSSDGGDYGTDNGYNFNSGQGTFGQDMSVAFQNQSGSFGNQEGFGPMGNSNNSLLGSYSNSRQLNLPQNSPNMKSGTGAFGRDGAVRPNFAGSYGRDGNLTPIGSGLRSLMGPPSIPPLQGSSQWGSGTSQSSLGTPQGQKRPFSHVLPSPEPSPEGDYIGQHSQGIGGHYADTYTKRQKLTGRF